MDQIPVRLASADTFARIREIFRLSEFHEDTIEKRHGGETIAFPPYPEMRIPPGADPAEILIGLFLRGGRLPAAELEAALGSQAQTDLQAAGLIAETGGMLQGTARVRPMLGLYVASDLWDTAADAGQPMADDVVFPPDISNTLTYLSYLPLTPCDRFLEACGGSGVAAVVAAQRYARQAYSFDIAGRSSAFAQFNGALNGLHNLEARTGDTYEPAGELTFDRIAAHPPYVPVLQHTWIYHAGGADGEQITRKHIEGIPKHLAPGGRFYCRAMGTDRLNQTFEQRLRAMLGEKQDEFDILLLVLRTVEPLHFVMQAIFRGRSKVEEIGQWEKAFNENQIVRFLPSVMVIQRHDAPRPAFTVRREKSVYTGAPEVEWLLQWETLRARGEAENLVLHNTLLAAPSTLQMKHQIKEGKWQMTGQTLEIPYPFRVLWDVDPMSAYIIPKMNGVRTGFDIFCALVSEGAIAGDQDPRRFAAVISELIAGGFVHVKGFEPPRPERRADPEAESFT